MEKENKSLSSKRIGFQEVQDKAYLLLKVEDVKKFIKDLKDNIPLEWHKTINEGAGKELI